MERALALFQTAWEKEVLSSSYTFWEQDYKNLCYVWLVTFLKQEELNYSHVHILLLRYTFKL